MKSLLTDVESEGPLFLHCRSATFFNPLSAWLICHKVIMSLY